MTAPYKLLKEHGYFAKKELGQNFLTDPSSPEMIIKKAGIEKGSNIIEIGPGLGALTIAASKSADKVFAVERDSRLIPLLEQEAELYQALNIEIINQDILKTDLSELLKKDKKNYIIGNLPYNISSQIIFKALEHKALIEKCVFMLQKELAWRICAKIGNKEYGRISAVLGYHADLKNIASLKPNLFYPRPKVDSCVIEIKFKKEIDNPAVSEIFFHNIVKTAFNQRRKTVKNSLSKIVKDKSLLESYFHEAQIPPDSRAENLDVNDYVNLSNIIYNNYSD
ncbi:MAG: 16S rRNA (adenine(1518)-N(6)/adenine(1519)-N(6))-dimethyltransferase RsmA, partial [Thermodesulfobacteriota bacterium]